MWPLVALLLLSSLCCGSAQLLFRNINSVMASSCDKVVFLPCYVSNIKAEDIKALGLNWKFGNTVILTFEGSVNKYSKTAKFESARISTSALLRGNASLKLNKNEAKEGNYTCAVADLGNHTVELKYRRDDVIRTCVDAGLGGQLSCRSIYSTNVRTCAQISSPQTKGSFYTSWFPLSENILIIIFPFLTVLLFWAQFGILLQKYKSNPMNKKIILLSTSGLLLTITVIVGAILFIPGNYSKTKSYGLIFFVTPSVIPLFLQYHKFKPAIGRTLYAMIILTTIQALGFVFTMAGLYHNVTVCEPKYGSLLISGLALITLVELFGLIYMKWLGILNPAIPVQTRMSDVCTIPSATGSPATSVIMGIISLFSNNTAFSEPVWTLGFLKVPSTILGQVLIITLYKMLIP